MAVAPLCGGVAMGQDTTDWTGFYAGVFAGYGLDTARATSSSIDPITVEQDVGVFVTFGQDAYSERIEAPFGGLQAGYNYQVDSFVLGVEGGVAMGGFDKSRGQSTTYNLSDGADFSNNTMDTQTEFSLDWLTTFAGRLGVDLDGWLVYGKAGVAVADISATSSSTYALDSNVGQGILGPFPNGEYTSRATHEGLKAGTVIGLGVEKKLTENVSLGVEYSFINLGNVEVSSAGLLGGLLGEGGPETFSANLHTVKASLNYHF
jgi:outer membrane immunogenic protein